MSKFLRFRSFLPGVLCCVLGAAAPAAAGTLSGVVRNGTTGSVVTRQDVILIQLQGGMQPVETAKTDEQGHYSFDRPEIGAAPMLVRVPYRGVNYHQNVPPGAPTADIEIFEPTADSGSLVLVNHAIVVRPDGASLVVGEEFSIHNLSKPPVTYFSNDGTFDFQIPDGSTLREVSAAGPAGMPLSQGTMDKGKNRYAIAFALKPGENTVRVSYQLAYTGNQAAVKVVTPLAAQRVVLAAPIGVQVASDGFAPAGNEQGYTFYSHDAVAANSPVEVAVSGSAAPASGAGGGDARDSGSAGTGAGGAAESGNISVVPPRLASVQVILVSGFLLLFGLGAFYLWRQPRAVAAVAAGNAGIQRPTPGQHGPAPGREARSEKRVRAENCTVESRPSATVAAVQSDVQLSLDELKDTLFRLELRHQAGTISEEEYTLERSRMESVLRNLVRP